MPLTSIKGVRYGSVVEAYGKNVSVPVGKGYIGCVLNAFGEPLNGNENVTPEAYESLYRPPLNPLSRCKITKPFATGIKPLIVC